MRAGACNVECVFLCSAKLKKSVAECSRLFQSFPALGEFVLELASLKQWHTLEIADHIPAYQCLVALIAKVEGVTDAEQVGDTYMQLISVVLFDIEYISWRYTVHNKVVFVQLYYR